MVVLLVPSDPLAPRVPDEHYAHEAEAARDAGLDVVVVDHDAIVAGEYPAALRRVPSSDVTRTAWYRGWMVSSAAYGRLGSELEMRGTRLLTSPASYAAAHELPGWYDTFAGSTPDSAWSPWEPGREPTSAEVGPLIETLGDGPGVVKDYVKSRKYEWDEACYVPDLADLATATQVIARMVELQGDDLAGGIVVRAFERFVSEDRGRAHEVRVWWVDGVPVVSTPHPDAPVGTGADVPGEVLDVVGLSVRAFGKPFVTTDLALRADGVWRVIEVGDGQVSDLHGGQDPGPLVRALAAAAEELGE